jgi:hypothetical protein
MRNRSSPTEGRNPASTVWTTSEVGLPGRIDTASETPRQRAESIHHATLPLSPLPRRRGPTKARRSVHGDFRPMPVGTASRVLRHCNPGGDSLVDGIWARLRRPCSVLRGRWRRRQTGHGQTAETEH